jgi:beta-phosphoglucomutase-like phosphatase (HAD superfamily)
MKDSVILTDVDGVLADWEWAFHIWMEQHGFTKQEGGQFVYSVGKRYGIDEAQGRKLIKLFNESAAIGFLPALRDAKEYVQRLHVEQGFVFHCITSLSRDLNAQRLREMNLTKLFGGSCFERFVFLDTGADKDQVLAEYQDSGCWWIEDKWLNCLAGLRAGLRPILMEHGHSLNFEHPAIHKVKNWAEIYHIISTAV